MPRDLGREDVPLGTIHHQWIIKEYRQYERSKTWYLIVGLIGAALLAYALLSNNNSFAVIIVLAAVILYLNEHQRPLELNFALTDAGIVLGEKVYTYREAERFWIVYEPGDVQALYLVLKGVVKKNVTIPLEGNDPRPIRQFLIRFVREDVNGEEPLSDRLSRIFKIQ